MNTASQINVEKLPYTINSGPLGGKIILSVTLHKLQIYQRFKMPKVKP